MKKIIILLAFFSFSLVSAQAPHVSPTIDPALEVSYQHLSERAAEHGKDLQSLTEQAGLVSINVVDSLPNGDLGAFQRTGSTFTVEISKIVLADPVSLEWVLAHEIGEGLGLKHVDKKMPDGSPAWSPEIMATHGVIDPTHLLYQIKIHPTYGPPIWKRYFDQL